MRRSNSKPSKKFILEAIPLSVMGLRVKKLEEIKLDFRIPILGIKNHNNENTEKLGIIAEDLWLNVFCNLHVNDILSLMLACKFFNEQTNVPETNARLQTYRRHQMLSRFFQEPRAFSLPEFRLPNVVPIEITLAEPELYQPGNVGFVMRRT